MIKTYEATGKTRDDAVRAALKVLGVNEDDVSVEVLTLPKSGFLGIGAVPAKVRVSYDDGKPEPVKSAPKAESKPAPRAESKPAPKAETPIVPAEKKVSAPKAELVPGSREERVYNFLHGLLEHMDVECSIDITEHEGGGLNVRLDGPNMGAVIGRRGETLDAIQHLVNYAINRGSDKHMHISVDAEDYRSKREESLVHLAEKMAAKAIKYKRSMALEPMNSYERHVIHTALQNYDKCISTSSTGVEPNRRVVVNYERAAGEAAEEHRSARREHGDRSRRSAPKAAPAPKAESVRAPVKDELPPDYPADYTPPTKNKPESREWC